MTVKSPAGTIVTLTTDNGSTFDNVFNGTRWDDDADPGTQVPYVTNANEVTEHTYANLTPVPNLLPEEPLGSFTGENPNGSWTVTISDDTNGDGGSLNSWSLDLQAAPTAPAIVATTTTTNSTPRDDRRRGHTRDHLHDRRGWPRVLPLGPERDDQPGPHVLLRHRHDDQVPRGHDRDPDHRQRFDLRQRLQRDRLERRRRPGQPGPLHREPGRGHRAHLRQPHGGDAADAGGGARLVRRREPQRDLDADRLRRQQPGRRDPQQLEPRADHGRVLAHPAAPAAGHRGFGSRGDGLCKAVGGQEDVWPWRARSPPPTRR